MPDPLTPSVALLHGAGYVGGELLRLLLSHPDVHVAAVTSRTFAGQPVHAAHASLRGQTDLVFSSPDALNVHAADALVLAAEHGQSMHVVPSLLDAGVEGPIVDLSADFRFADASIYPAWYGTTHAAPHLLEEAVYGLPELNAIAPGTSLIANPGCFATGMALALAPLAGLDIPLTASVTALTGASGSGATPKAATHFPDRDGNVRAYKVLAHQHVPEVQHALGDHLSVQFVPTSGPWTRGIWGTAHVALPDGLDAAGIEALYAETYADAPCVRLSPGTLPEMKAVVGTPFCDLGWVVKDDALVIGFSLDNLLKGAASQAIQNLNLALGLPTATGLLPTTPSAVASSTA